ncbi:cohesin complex subunit SA-1/2 [Marchantia polymorpha subsp. ruderalis]|uniref:Cohesin subunit SA-3 n=2 Tax=Marchantia polymorpha TaxID=3197 RepID=A0AAF6AWA7_MARPO|nr:hypothetical protein MARPO_0007s0132 [Marchantia polymorpha]BBN04041.1 hypothetical protein Mp_3g01380 [Marchantia polymorpha subsp. ruderalis]|eukprot:PTQ47728.1 hypothetical protein MARPO_0007s0132 [Marchantia polymorpha]
MDLDHDFEPGRRNRRQAVLNSVLLKEVMDSSGSEGTDPDDPDVEEPTRKRSLGQESNRPKKRAKANGVEREKEGGPKRKRQHAFIAEEPDADNEDLIDVLKHKGKVVRHAAAKWVERYEANPDLALGELLKALFQACGVKSGLDTYTWTEVDIDDAVRELVDIAKNDGLEDYLGSKQRDFRNFKDNLVTFWDSLVRECQDGALFDQKLMEKSMDYVIALSCTPPRTFRRVGTLVGCQLVTSLVGVAKRLGESRETAQRQLNAEKKKRKDGPRVESLNKTLSETHEKITTVEEMMRKIFTGLFMHRYRDVDSEIRMACITAIGSWISAYPSLFLQDLYLKYIGWTLNDKNPTVRRSSVLALQALYAVDDNIPSLGLFTERFSTRMIELADDIDVNVAVSAIGLLKQLLRHQLLEDDELGPLYEFLIDESPQIRHAVGDLVYDHLIAPAAGGKDNENLQGQLERLLQILREFSGDPILCDYVIDALWDKCKAMKDWKCMTTMLLEDRQSDELTDRDATNLVRVLSASVKKAVGEKIVPSSDHRKVSLTKAQKESLEASKKEMTLAMIKSLTKLLRKYLADQAKVSALVEIIFHMKLELYSLQRKEQSFAAALQLIKDAFVKHGDSNTLKACVKSLAFAANESHADLQDSAQQIFKQTVDDLSSKLKSAIGQLGDAEDDYSLTVNLRRMYQLQLAIRVSNEGLFADMLGLLDDFSNLDDEVVRLIFLNMYLHITWSLSAIDPHSPDETAIASLLTIRARLIQHLYSFMDFVLDSWDQGNPRNVLTCTMCLILSDVWSLFSEAKLAPTKLRALGFCPPMDILERFWQLCEYRLSYTADEGEEEITEGPTAEFLNEKDMVMTAAAKLIAHDMVPKDFLGPEILSHYALHGKIISETVKQLLAKVKQQLHADDLSGLYLNAMKRAYQRHLVEVSGSDDDLSKSPSFAACKDLAVRLSSSFLGMARAKYRPSIMEIVKGGVKYAFYDAPKQLSFLEGGVIQFALKLPAADIREILSDIEPRVRGIDTDQDPSGWRPYFTFVELLREKSAKHEMPSGEKEGAAHPPPARSRRRIAKKGVRGKKLFEAHYTSSEEDEIEEVPSESDNDHDEVEEDEDDDTPLYNIRQSVKTGRRSNLATRPNVSRLATMEASREISSPSADNVELEEHEIDAGRASPDGAMYDVMTATEEQLPAMNVNWRPSHSMAEQVSRGNTNWRPSPLRLGDDEDISKGSSKDDSPSNSSDVVRTKRIRSKLHNRPLSSEEAASGEGYNEF